MALFQISDGIGDRLHRQTGLCQEPDGLIHPPLPDIGGKAFPADLPEFGAQIVGVVKVFFRQLAQGELAEAVLIHILYNFHVQPAGCDSAAVLIQGADHFRQDHPHIAGKHKLIALLPRRGLPDHIAKQAVQLQQILPLKPDDTAGVVKFPVKAVK